MRVTVFTLEDDRVEPHVDPSPAHEPREAFDGKPLKDVTGVDVQEVPGASMELEIARGGSFAMHSSPDVAFCQIVRGRGKLGLPAGRELDYEGPELYIFLPDTEHDWHDIEEDTLLAVCLVEQS